MQSQTLRLRRRIEFLLYNLRGSGINKPCFFTLVDCPLHTNPAWTDKQANPQRSSELCSCSCILNACFSYAILGWHIWRQWPYRLPQELQMTWGKEIFLLHEKSAGTSWPVLLPIITSLLPAGSHSSGEQQWLRATVYKSWRSTSHTTSLTEAVWL